jgi:hypothetical protein
MWHGTHCGFDQLPIEISDSILTSAVSSFHSLLNMGIIDKKRSQQVTVWSKELIDKPYKLPDKRHCSDDARSFVWILQNKG